MNGMNGMSRKGQQILAAGLSVVIIAGWGTYWAQQVQSVVELLRMAYG
ncbi:MAG: hypothetical protein O2780_14270 [Proteobacteria bacterium]|jgi:hypothetical protein|nr:hypothetical protein [Pseudomonadota bacterium]MDA1300767.1 hypothetical protein [Pseudomonadota bacterium]